MLSSLRLIRPAARLSTRKFVFPRSAFLSTSPPQDVAASHPSAAPQLSAPQPPKEINEEMIKGIQDATKLFIRYGLGKQRLEEISKDKSTPLVTKWQKMMEAFLGTQVHVIAALGYTPDEQGLAKYNQDLAVAVQRSDPAAQEAFRTAGRDTWREVLSTAFEMDLDEFKELSIVDARNVMHKVSEKMQSDEVIDEVAKRCASIVPNENPQMEMAQKHHIVQEILVDKVYCGGEPSLVSECGFGEGEEGYVYMQCVMAEHQNDPLVAQYIGTAMTKILAAAGFELGALGQQAAQN